LSRMLPHRNARRSVSLSRNPESIDRQPRRPAPVETPLDAITVRLRRTLRFALAWACLLAAIALYFLINLPGTTSAIYFAASLGFMAASIAALRFYRIGLLVVIAIVFLFTLASLPFTLVNLWMMATSHPLYLDSPA